MREKKRYLVTRAATVTVEARSADEAEQLGELQLMYFGSDTLDIEVEEIDEG